MGTIYTESINGACKYMKIKNRISARLTAVLLCLSLLISGGLFAAGLYPFNYIDTQSVDALSKLGSRGEEVRRIQTKLKELGYYNHSVDGIYGSRTKKAVTAFQKNCGITADGIAGPKTLLYLGLGNSSASGGYSSNDIYLLAKLIAAEARGESYTGQVAVGAVVLNRVEHGSFPDSISGVIYQSGAFSAVNDSNWSVAPNATSQKAARDAINGWDPSGGAIYYYNPRTAQSDWIRSRPIIATIGNHVFCS